tara:strand:- start:67 stop:597 length:531 start_codon:yes stop_codon:yes gene_type:complete
MDDKILIEKFLRGDIKSYNELVHRHQGWVRGMTLNIVKNTQDAEDISQDVFVKVYFGLNYFRFESEFKTWLYRVVINKINNHFRKQKLRSVFSAELKEEMSEGADSSTSNENRLFEMTPKLPRFQRNIVLLRVYQDLSFKMVGGILNITENSAKVSFHKAKANLKIYYRKKYGECR